MNTRAMNSPDRRSAHSAQDHTAGMQMASYGRFVAMILVSTALGYAATFLDTYEPDHMHWSWTRVFMSMIMAGVMTATMMLFMWKMYPSRKANLGMLALAAALCVAGVALVRSQATVDDVAYMRAMIPHHSIAILTSERARISDPEVRKLADGIIETQKREISEMDALIAKLQQQ